MSQPDPFAPVIAWRRWRSHPEREPVEVDVQDGRAEYQLSGPYRMSEGSKIEVIGGKVVWSGSSSRHQTI
ncbi:hypothetical protein [Pseudomonas abietaniphila]|uniref:Uncharacterized protein n=1 Tax=Pseudomonas abietaniphila TaxID=89065 RepID=A0A1G8K7V7_9PSED|nr:hypothetical protein [Pseudomonas abietaniphila]SDI39535.1 hypothetical protein SAMN05216605_1135 [Pseudomonas abietaniphila]